MEDLYDLIKRYTIKHDQKLKKICAPLKEILEIDVFCYNTIETNGRYGTLCNFAEELDYYYSQKLYLDYPYHRCPSLFRSGITVTQTTYNAPYYDLIHQKFCLSQIFTLVERRGDRVEFFLFGKQAEKGLKPDLCADLSLLRKFAKYFKREASSLIRSMLEDGYNMKEAKGAAFTQVIPNIPLSSDNSKRRKFLKAICPLTRREEDLMDFLKEGISSRETAAYLGLSQRTVEHYYDNIKAKLGCTSKSQLLEWC